MRTTVTKSSWFAPKLRDAIDRPGAPIKSVRGLARAWRPNDFENARRSIHRYLQDGIVPGPAIRREFADLLGLPEDGLERDADEEADPVGAFQRSLMALVRSAMREASER